MRFSSTQADCQRADFRRPAITARYSPATQNKGCPYGKAARPAANGPILARELAEIRFRRYGYPLRQRKKRAVHICIKKKVRTLLQGANGNKRRMQQYCIKTANMTFLYGRQRQPARYRARRYPPGTCRSQPCNSRSSSSGSSCAIPSPERMAITSGAVAV